MKYPKNKRIVDTELMATYHVMQCLLCNQVATPSHVKTRGSGGHDVEWNIVPLCVRHHTEWGHGWSKFCDKYPSFWLHLVSKGWTILNGKLFNTNQGE